MAKGKVIVVPVNENNTFSKFIYAVGLDLKFDNAFNLVLLSTWGTKSYATLNSLA